jgi:hypothetical protein
MGAAHAPFGQVPAQDGGLRVPGADNQHLLPREFASPAFPLLP